MKDWYTMDNGDLIVVAEDDRAISDLIELYLRRDGFNVYQTPSGDRALEVTAERNPCLVVLDLGLTGSIDGVEVCRRLRAKSRVPIIMVTARDDEVDRILGLEVGADDYLVKPFSPRELLARIRAVLRRIEYDTASDTSERDPVVEIGDLTIDRVRHEVRCNGVVVHLAAREYDLLDYLAQNQGLALSRRQILDAVWDQAWVGDDRTVDVHVGQLRKKLGPGLDLHTVRGHGYRLG